MKPLTQSEIDATGLLDGWTVDDMYETLIDPTGFRFRGCVKTAITRLVRACIANRLEAAPQPLIEQSESTHPLQEFCDELEELLWKEVNAVRLTPYRTADDICTAVRNLSNKYNPRYAPPAVIEPEPELDEFEQWIQDMHLDRSIALSDRYLTGLNDALEKYREIISRKGDK